MAERLQSYWSRKLEPPIILGNGARLTTLTDARTLISSLPETSRRAPYWQYALALVVDAAQFEDSKLADVRSHLMRALKAERMI